MFTEQLDSLSWFIAIAVLVINFIAFLAIGIDKKKSIDNTSNRIPEVYFFVWSVFFSALGVFVGMIFFRHKTRKLTFIFGIGLLALQQLLLIYLLLIR